MHFSGPYNLTIGNFSLSLQKIMHSMKTFDFDSPIDRHGSGAMKTDGLSELFGRDDITGMWIADMDFAVDSSIAEALISRLHHPIYGYTRVPDSYWQSIIGWLDRRHGWAVEREELMFSPGVVKGIGYIINFFTRPGDKIVIQPPVYHPFKILIEGNGRVAVNNPLVETDDHSYRMDLGGLEQIFATEHPAMMILCNPHNPAGIQWDEETLRNVASLARKHGVKVISDEIHGDLVLYGQPHYPFLAVSDDAAEVGIALGAPSKTFNIPGMVSSWIVVKNKELREPFYHWMEANEFCEPTFFATIATEAAYNNGEQWLDAATDYIEGNIKAVEEYCAENMPMIHPWRPQASFLTWLDCRELGLSQDELEKLFIDEAHLALNSGTMFGAEGEGFMRFNVACPRCRLIEALESVAKAVAHVTVSQCC